jgi:hypothetical protein
MMPPLSTGEDLLFTPSQPAREPFAHGRYDYFLNDAPAGVFEPWSIERLSDGGTCTRCTRDARAFGSGIVVECDHDARGDVREFRARVLNSGRVNFNAATQIDAVYTITGGRVQVRRQVVGEAVTDELHDCPPGLLVFPLMRVFMAAVIEAAAAHDGQLVTVLVPDLAAPNDAARVLRPVFDPRRVRALADETAECAARADGPPDCRVYQYMGGNYQDEEARFTVGRFGVHEGEALRLLYGYTWAQREGVLWRAALMAG